MDNETRVGGNEGSPDDEAEPELGDGVDVLEPPDEEVLHQLISDELGESIAELMRQMRRAQEAWRRRSNPGEGLRERKRRLTRQLISDAATLLFAIHGFDNVKVAEVADRVGVSEKTIYNYFPTKESLVLEGADETIERVATALRERRSDESLTQAVVRALKDGLPNYEEFPDELVSFIPAFGDDDRLDAGTARGVARGPQPPGCRRSRRAREHGRGRSQRPRAGDRRPGARGAGRRRVRVPDPPHQAGLRGEALRREVIADLDRAARVIETGLWSFNLLARGARAKSQALEAARAAEEARTQVIKAVRQAREAWAQVREQSRAEQPRGTRPAERAAPHDREEGPDRREEGARTRARPAEVLAAWRP